MKSGYTFTYSPGPADSRGRISAFSFTGNPINSSTGTQYYHVDQSGVTRQNSTTNASFTDSPVGG
jgi:hypothetical protein